MISDGGVVVTDEDWEINKGLSSRPAIEAMDIHALLERGFHLKPHDCFPDAPSFLRGVGGVPSSSAFPPLWSLRLFASRISGREVLTARTLRAPPRSGALTLWCVQSSWCVSPWG